MKDSFPFDVRCYFEDHSILTIEMICEKQTKDVEYERGLIGYALKVLFLALKFCGSPIGRNEEFLGMPTTSPNIVRCYFSIFFKNDYNRKRFLEELVNALT